MGRRFTLASLGARLVPLLAPLLPLAAGLVALRLPEWLAAQAAGLAPADAARQILANEALALLRWLPLWCLAAWPLLRLPAGRLRRWSFGLLGSLVLLAQWALVHYFSVAGVALGAELFAYTPAEVLLTTEAALHDWPAGTLAALALGLALLWGGLWVQARRAGAWPLLPVLAPGLLAISLSSPLWLPGQWAAQEGGASLLTQNKLALFLNDVVAKTAARAASPGPAAALAEGLDPAYPFARPEQTPDTLGPLLALPEGERPNFVFIIVEGLGRSFSGPGARLGSFTPFLDELAGRSLYWENFVAPQGRTFAVLPSVFGSLPFGPNSFNALAPAMPAHDSLLSLLKAEGYALRYYTGTRLDFDNQGAYLAAEGVGQFFSERDFQPPARRMTDWGYADGDLLEAVAARERQAPAGPFVAIVQTMTMHSPFDFPGRAMWERRVDERLDQLGVPAQERAMHERHRAIFASILYTDDALRRLFAQLAEQPAWRNTLVVVTGDHRLPELPMDTRLERYHVPLILSSPLLRAPRRIGAVSSHFDIAPSLLALLSQRYGLHTPATVAWMGRGLDVETEFRNLHALPMQQTKTELSDYLHGDYYLGQDRLYRLTGGLQPVPVEQPALQERLRAAFAAFRAANATVAQAARLTPPAAAGQRIGYLAADRRLPAPQFGDESVVVSGTRVQRLPDGSLQVQGRYTQRGRESSPTFVPLLVLTDGQGRELGEAYGQAMRLQAAYAVTVALQLPPPREAGPHYVSLIVSDPDTGRPVGTGQYHVDVPR